MAYEPFSVKQLSLYIERILKTDPLLNRVRVQGHIIDLKKDIRGNIYFSLSDGMYSIRCIVFSDTFSDIKLINEGDEVIIEGAIYPYAKKSTYSINVERIEPTGKGNIYDNFEKLKAQLKEEGLFDNKKAIPKYVKRIGIVTSKHGAAIKDIIDTIEKYTNSIDIYIFSVSVQGELATDNIVKAFNLIDEKYTDVLDVVIVGRGGGDSNDLKAFSEESVARAVASCKIPTISAVGHAIDISLTDFVADKMVETPTAAAELVIRDMKDLEDKLEDAHAKLISHITSLINMRYNRLNLCKNTASLSINNLMNISSKRVDGIFQVLTEINPSKLIKEGYLIMQDENNHRISSISNLEENKEYTIILGDGSARVTVVGVDFLNCNN